MSNKKLPANKSIPKFIKGFLWSYDIEKLDLERDFKRIATNILIYGDMNAVCWLFNTFNYEQIKKIVLDPLKGDWDPKSLSFWSGYFNVAFNKKVIKKID